MPTKIFIPAVTLIELLVVIAVLGILATVVGPNISNWNCRQETKNDFAELNGFLTTLRIEAVNRNRTMFASVRRAGRDNNALIKAYQGPEGKKKTCKNNAEWIYLGQQDIFDYESESHLENFNNTVCFNADGTATGGVHKGYTLGRMCGDTYLQYKNQIFGATGFINKEKYNLKTSKWDEL
jgi:prepilin-type N-terminal cleavage/methylation domain-containing protein